MLDLRSMCIPDIWDSGIEHLNNDDNDFTPSHMDSGTSTILIRDLAMVMKG